MGGYFTYQEFLDEIDQMANLYPILITQPQNISNFLTEGTPDSSTTPPIGGNGIKWVKISDNPNSSTEGEPELLYTSVHHARKPTSLSQLIFFMWYLLENYESTDWEINSFIFTSPPSSITDSSTGFYQNNESKSITISEEINLPNDIAGATASFYTQWKIEKSKDYVQFEVSTDNGTTWTPQCGKYTNEGSGLGVQPEGEPLYDSIQNDWVLEEINLNQYIGESILLRFQLVTNESVIKDGFYFDDLKVNIVESGFLDVSSSENIKFNIFPNPVQEYLNVSTILDNFSIEIYTIHGQLINKTLYHSNSTTIDYSSY